jgi:Immunity protein 35
VVTYEEARHSAQRLLDGLHGGPYVITENQQYPVGWVFFWDSRQHQESGSLSDELGGNAPILIDRDTGRVCPTGTARQVEEYVAEHAEHKRRLREGWPDSLDARFLALLALARDGMGLREARHLDLLIGARHEPRHGRTVLDELIELERRGLPQSLRKAARETRPGPGTAAANAQHAQKRPGGPELQAVAVHPLR